MATAPFPNHYTCRLVSASDSKACSVCYKPTTAVLLSQNSADFFYICESHLKDKTFAEAIHPEEYLTLVKEKNGLDAQIKALERKAAAVKPYSWNKMMNTIGWDNSQEKDEPDAQSDDKDKDSTPPKSYDELNKKIKELGTKASSLSDSIASFKFKNYKLDPGMYRMRINNLLQAQNRLRRQKEVQAPGFFPLAPSHLLS